jgi:hypothetical protein
MKEKLLKNQYIVFSFVVYMRTSSWKYWKRVQKIIRNVFKLIFTINDTIYDSYFYKEKGLMLKIIIEKKTKHLKAWKAKRNHFFGCSTIFTDSYLRKVWTCTSRDVQDANKKRWHHKIISHIPLVQYKWKSCMKYNRPDIKIFLLKILWLCSFSFEAK